MRFLLLSLSLSLTCGSLLPADNPESAALRVLQYQAGEARSPFHGALYAQPTGTVLTALSRRSEDNGKTWKSHTMTPDFAAGLPEGYRRGAVTSVVDPNNGRLVTIVNALDTPGLDPTIDEPPIALSTYYLRYRVSEDAGLTWAFEEPIVQAGDYTPEHPFEGIFIGQNSIFLGDAGSIPLVTREGKVLVPTLTTLVGPDGELANPGGGFTYSDALILIGEWTADGRLSWTASERIMADPARSTRGMIEPTLAEFPDGRLLCVMRGSNGGEKDPEYKLPSHKWFSVSSDGGRTWTDPEPWTYEDGEPFFSPSSMSTLLPLSSGRVFWIGNMSAENCEGNSPRWPLVLGEVDPVSLSLLRSSVLEVDTRREEDLAQGRLDISHITALEDRETGQIILSYPRAHNSYQQYEWAEVRLEVKP